MEVKLIEAGVRPSVIGKDVIDARARRLGFVSHILLRHPPTRVFLVVRSQNYYLEIPLEDVEEVSDAFIQLSKEYDIPEPDPNSLAYLKSIRARDELLSVILKALPTFLKEFEDVKKVLS